MLVQDNQQVTSWFVGILEGEGNFELRPNGFYRIKIANIDLGIIEKCKEFLAKNLILFQEIEYIPKNRKHKKSYSILVSEMDCYNLYKLLQSKMECRLQEYQKIIGTSETIRDVSLDLDWLIGIWEAEGTLYISQGTLKEVYVPYLSLENTNIKIIKKVVLALKELGCAWYCKDFIPTVHTPYTRISINGMKRCHRFLLKTRNQWQSNRNIKRSNLMLEYIESRFSKPYCSPYDDREREIYRELKQLNI